VQRGNDGELQLTSRVREIRANPFNLDAVMHNLFAGGVTEAEREEQLINLVPHAEFSITRTVFAPAEGTSGGPGCTPAGASAQIDLPEDFFDQFATQSAQRLAIGQIVLTMIEFNTRVPLDRRIDSVQFTVANRAKSVPTANPDSGFVPIVRANSFAALLEPQAQVVTGNATEADTCGTTDVDRSS
jgi:hypothetical protein